MHRCLQRRKLQSQNEMMLSTPYNSHKELAIVGKLERGPTGALLREEGSLLLC